MDGRACIVWFEWNCVEHAWCGKLTQFLSITCLTKIYDLAHKFLFSLCLSHGSQKKSSGSPPTFFTPSGLQGWVWHSSLLSCRHESSLSHLCAQVEGKSLHIGGIRPYYTAQFNLFHHIGVVSSLRQTGMGTFPGCKADLSPVLWDWWVSRACVIEHVF